MMLPCHASTNSIVNAVPAVAQLIYSVPRHELEVAVKDLFERPGLWGLRILDHRIFGFQLGWICPAPINDDPVCVTHHCLASLLILRRQRVSRDEDVIFRYV